MSGESLSSPSSITVRIVEKNKKISIDNAITLENLLSVHNLLATSHPYLLNKVNVLEQIAQNLNLKDQELASSFENAIGFHNQLLTAHPAILTKINELNQAVESLELSDEELEASINQNLVLKANTSLSNLTSSAAQSLNAAGIRTVTDTYKNGANWYRKWSDGFIEQGGTIAVSNTTVQLIIPFTNTNYSVQANPSAGQTNQSSVTYHNTKTLTSFNLINYLSISGVYANNVDWEAKGF